MLVTSKTFEQLVERVDALEKARDSFNYQLDNFISGNKLVSDEIRMIKNLLTMREHSVLKKQEHVEEPKIIRNKVIAEPNTELQDKLKLLEKELADEKYKHYLTDKKLENWRRKYKEDTGKDPIVRKRRNRVDKEIEAAEAAAKMTEISIGLNLTEPKDNNERIF
jgi:hypothetical protein